MKICYFGIYDPTYSRNDILLSGLRQVGVEVIECRADWKDPRRYFKLWKSLRSLNNQYDYVYAAYPSPLPTIIARLISKRPVISDAFYSMFDAVVNDRKEVSWWHPRALKLFIIDWLAVMLAHLVTTDTAEHKRYWESWLWINGDKIHPVYLGINDKIFYPLPPPAGGRKKDQILVHFHGKYIPVQGVPKIIEAARICSNDPKLKFRLVGSGADSEKVRKMVEKYDLKNIEFVGRVSLAELNSYMAEADIVLGIFGDIARGQRAIPNKVYEGLAAQRAMMTTDTPAIREIFTDKDILLVRNDPQSIANGIITLAENENRRDQFAKNGYEAVKKYTPVPIANSLVKIIHEYASK